MMMNGFQHRQIIFVCNIRYQLFVDKAFDFTDVLATMIIT